MDDMNEQDQELQLTPVQYLMINAHEMLICAKSAGFSHEDSLYLVANLICGGPKIPSSDD